MTVEEKKQKQEIQNMEIEIAKALGIPVVLQA
jgi:hypothetical protein